MRIIIEHCRKAPDWDLIEELIKSISGDPDQKIECIRPVDPDGSLTKTGVFQLEVSQSNETSFHLTVEAVPIGQASKLMVDRELAEYEAAKKRGEDTKPILAKAMEKLQGAKKS